MIFTYYSISQFRDIIAYSEVIEINISSFGSFGKIVKTETVAHEVVGCAVYQIQRLAEFFPFFAVVTVKKVTGIGSADICNREIALCFQINPVFF